jgi:hypothetical protein
MEKYYKTKEEMKKDNKNLRIQTLADIYKLKKEGKKEFKKQIMKWCLMIIIPIILFKLIFGTIIIGYVYPFNRLYSVTLNDIKLTVGAVEEKTITIIPFIVKMKLFSNNTFYGDDLSSVVIVKQGEKYILNIKSYNCFAVVNNVKAPLKCSNENKKTINELNTDTTYKVLITESKKNGKELYNGPFISDITAYLKETGYYNVFITGKYSNVESRINFGIKIIE